MKVFYLVILSLFFMKVTAQELPYYEIPEAPKEFTAGTVASRMVDGLGFRYYWATEGLTEKDLKHKPSKEARSTFDTVDHILVLSILIVNATQTEQVEFPAEGALTFKEIRVMTLNNFKKASKALNKTEDLSSIVMKIKRDNGKVVEYPFWNQINGPIEDAVWHCGQLVSFRRSSGNPMSKGVSLLTGKVRK